MRVRNAAGEDADAIALVHVRCWQTAYRGHMPRTYLDGLEVAARAAGGAGGSPRSSLRRPSSCWRTGRAG